MRQLAMFALHSVLQAALLIWFVYQIPAGPLTALDWAVFGYSGFCSVVFAWVSINSYGFSKFLGNVFRTREIYKPEGLYLRRFYLSPRVRWLPFQIFLHNIRLDDDRNLHDHPWRFLTIILRGSYRETIRTACGWCGFHMDERVLTPGSIRFNGAEHTHRVQIIRPVWSLVIAGRPKRQWGFGKTVPTTTVSG